MAGPLIQLVYVSATTAPASPEDLHRLLAQARRANRARGITGLLLHDNGSYFQVLEGPPTSVEPLFARIAHDPRHGRVMRLLTAEVTERAFPDWTMGYSGVTVADLARTEGLSDIFDRATYFTALDAGKAALLIAAFRNGLFHMGDQMEDEITQ